MEDGSCLTIALRSYRTSMRVYDLSANRQSESAALDILVHARSLVPVIAIEDLL